MRIIWRREKAFELSPRSNQMGYLVKKVTAEYKVRKGRDVLGTDPRAAEKNGTAYQDEKIQKQTTQKVQPCGPVWGGGTGYKYSVARGRCQL